MMDKKGNEAALSIKEMKFELRFEAPVNILSLFSTFLTGSI